MGYVKTPKLKPCPECEALKNTRKFYTRCGKSKCSDGQVTWFEHHYEIEDRETPFPAQYASKSIESPKPFELPAQWDCILGDHPAPKVDMWVPDDLALNCMICDAPFAWNLRHHHCRRCGRNVCDACAPLNILKGDDADDRVCKECNPKSNQ